MAPAKRAPNTIPPATRKELEREVEHKLRELVEQVKRAEAKLQSGEMSLSDLAD